MRSRTMRRGLVLLPIAAILGCSEPAPVEPDAFRVTRDAAPFDIGPVDAFALGAPDAFCGPTPPDPDRTVTCSPCEPRCYLTREQPGPGDPLEDGVEHDLVVNGVRLSQGSDGHYVPEGRHARVHDSTLTCDPLTELPAWETIDYDVEIPAGTSIDFELHTASSTAALASARPALVHATSGHGSFDATTALLSAGATVSQRFLSITVVLHASADGTQTPVFLRYDLRHQCLPGM